MSPQSPDFERLFAEGSQHDLGHWRPGLLATIRTTTGPQLRLPTGRLVACEPGAYFPDGAGRHAFVQHVEPGSYPVRLVIADYVDPDNPQGNTTHAEVAAARLVIRNEPVTVWRMAVSDGQDEATLADDEYYGYSVDSGTGAFASPEVLDGLYDDLGKVGDLSYDMVYAGRDISEYVDARTGNNLVMFPSGGGDGHYPTWVGFTADGEIACFLTDFVTLTPPENEADVRDAPETPTTEQHGTSHDESGLVSVRVFSQRAAVADSHVDLAARVDAELVVVGGGGTAWDPADPQTPNGTLLTASWPDPELSAWLVSSKDHHYVERHRPVAYAIGLAIAGISRAELRAAMHVSTAETFGQHPEVTARLPDGYVLVSGGAAVEWQPGSGSLLTASFPADQRSWTAAAKDHGRPNPARLRVFAIGLREELTVGRVEVRISDQKSGVASHPRATATVADGYALTGGGAQAYWRGAGSLLWQSAPLPDSACYTAGAKDHGVPAPCDLSAYAVGIRIVPRS